jgi:hypothetical protein
VLTDPVINSSKQKYGPADWGPKGISNFFSNHTCNEYCKSSWLVPHDQTRYWEPVLGTSLSSAGTGAQQQVKVSRRKYQQPSPLRLTKLGCKIPDSSSVQLPLPPPMPHFGISSRAELPNISSYFQRVLPPIHWPTHLPWDQAKKRGNDEMFAMPPPRPKRTKKRS